MDTVPLFLCLVLLTSLARGQLDQDALQPDYEYENGQFLEDDEILPKEYISMKTPQEQRFMEGLVIEAGRKVLFPELYERPEDEAKGQAKFFEIKGQPEIEESYMNEKVRRSKKGCPQEHCPRYKPVCGSDGKVYQSECHLRKENCGASNVTLGPWPLCRGKHYLCPSRCLDINDPVCGSDGRIYHNMCIMRKRNCGKLIKALPVRKCYENVRQSKEMSDCPETCQELYKPACGSDGVIYYNECFLRKRTCKLGIVEVEMEGCAFVPECPEVCLPISDPVCGSDGRLYVNQCRMLQANCGKEIKVVAKRLCGYPGKEATPAIKQMKK